MKLTLINRKQEVENCFSFIFKPENSLSWKAGQFLHYHLDDPKPDERETNRFFSIAAAPFEENVMLTTKFMPGDGSTFKQDLQKLSLGQTLEVSGPNGSFIVEDPEKKYVFIAGGIGITPFRAILLQLNYEQKPINVTLLYANRNDQIIYQNELDVLNLNNPNFQIHYLIDPQKVDEQTVRSLVPDLKTPIFYISGPEPMVQAIETMLEGMGIEKERVKRDYFPGYEGI